MFFPVLACFSPPSECCFDGRQEVLSTIIQRICEKNFKAETSDILTNGATMCIISSIDWCRVCRVKRSRKSMIAFLVRGGQGWITRML